MDSLLLTGTIDPSKFNNSMTTLSDVSVRLNQYHTAIIKWLKKSNFSKIIFIENSGYPFDYKQYEMIADKLGKKFEYISADSFVDETIKYGKSYGEIKIINEAIEKSQLLKDETYFYKCTGRLFIRNCNSLLREKHCKETVFTGVPDDKWAFTWFFKVNKDFYEKHLSQAFNEVNDYQGIFMEHIYYKVLSSHLDEIELFRKYPNVTGVSAGTNSKYHSGLIRYFFKNIQVKRGYFGIR